VYEIGASRLRIPSVSSPHKDTTNATAKSNTTQRDSYDRTMPMEVNCVELQATDGTRRIIQGIVVDENSLTFHDENPTVKSLKHRLFPDAAAHGAIKVYSPPVAATATENTPWDSKSPSDVLVQNAMYGYIDLRRLDLEQQQQNGKLRCCFSFLVFQCCFEYE
jgi:hypothetical protein